MLGIILLALFGQAKPAPEPPPVALHLIVESRFTFMSSTQTATVEQWITENMTYEKRANRVMITRNDRALRWLIDTQKSTYSEMPLVPQQQSAAPRTVPEDIHTAGFDYDPAFAWVVSKPGKTETIDGRACREMSATGTADFAGIEMKLRLCRGKEPALERKANARILDAVRFRYQDALKFALGFLSRQPDMVLMSIEATVDSPIAQSMYHDVKVLTLEKAAPPPGIFDLPSGLQKMLP